MKKPLNLKSSPALYQQKNHHFITPWRILIVDDEEDVHSVTRLILAKILFKQRPVELLNAYSAAQAEQLLQTETDIAVILLDVVMETEDAGLRLVQVIRNQLNNKAARIILRTGQPGQAPEESVILDYDINDYKAKSELTAQSLFTAVIASLRSYESIISLQKTRAGLEKILHSSDSLFQIHSICEFASGVLTQVSSYLGCKPGGIICLEENAEPDAAAISCSLISSGCMKVLAATGEYSGCLDCRLDAKCCHPDMVAHILRALQERKNQFEAHYTVLYLETGEHKATIALVTSGLVVDENDRSLLSVFASKISIALANAIHYQKMISFEEAATTDFLTSLNNRRQLLRLGIPLLAGANRHNTPIAVALLDIDYFKRINDSYGHDVGDIVLKKIGGWIKQRFRSSDIVARYGGEEFCVITPQLPKLQVFELFDKFRMMLAAQSIELNSGEKLAITVSIGITTVLCSNLDEMISCADELLYAAKQGGRNRVVMST
jgi:diguanylate cyclase (GGDEF)-like protein